MPLGFERLNERKQRPNACINFIKPLATASAADQQTARDFLERIAAQCYPVMKRDYLSVMSLEEYPPNREFLGRNFNAGEVIQLVLKDKAGRWLNFNFVQMVMMHELAHCKQMNHSKFFWQVRNRYADHMKELWGKKYTGEGLWGRGQSLPDGRFIHDRMPEGSDIPEHLCGGTYRRARGGKRKRGQSDKPSLSYAERQQKRIARKFGIHGEGQDLGEDELLRGAIESMKGSKRQYSKPRVANSKRGRELRANAALARFETAKIVKAESEPDVKDENASETEWSGDEGDMESGTVGFDGKKIKDEHGHDLVRMCGDEGEQDDGFQNEMDDIRQIGVSSSQTNRKYSKQPQMKTAVDTASSLHERSDAVNDAEAEPANVAGSSHVPTISRDHEEDSETETEDAENEVSTIARDPDHVQHNSNHSAQLQSENMGQSYGSVSSNSSTCPICSLENESSSPTCMACAHVLKPRLMPDHWSCSSGSCKGSEYINAGDAGRCGICGAQRPKPSGNIVRHDGAEKQAIGVVSADVLRWD